MVSRLDRVAIQVFILIALGVVYCERSTGTPPTIVMPFHCKWAFDSILVPSRPTTVQFEFAPGEHKYDSVNVTITPIGKLGYDGNSNWNVVFVDTIPKTYKLTISIPPNDTSGILIELASQGLRWPERYYFVTTDDTVEVYVRHIVERNRMRAYQKYVLQNCPPNGRWIKTQFSMVESLYLAPPTDAASDSCRVNFQPRSNFGQREKDQMSAMEMAPETLWAGRVIFVDGEPWSRREGAKKFENGISSEDRAKYDKRTADSIKRVRAEMKFDVWLDLSDSVHFLLAKAIADSLNRCEFPRIFHVRVTGDDLFTIATRGIPLYRGKALNMDSLMQSRARLKELSSLPNTPRIANLTKVPGNGQIAESTKNRANPTLEEQIFADGSTARYHKMNEEEKEYNEMRRLEENPCNDTAQHFKVGDRSYVRFQGDWLFRLASTCPGGNPWMNPYVADSFRYEIVLFAPDTMRFQLAIRLSGNLGQVRSGGSGYYRSYVDTSTHRRLEKADIVCKPTFEEVAEAIRNSEK